MVGFLCRLLQKTQELLDVGIRLVRGRGFVRIQPLGRIAVQNRTSYLRNRWGHAVSSAFAVICTCASGVGELENGFTGDSAKRARNASSLYLVHTLQ